jgi:hypothetical protein
MVKGKGGLVIDRNGGLMVRYSQGTKKYNKKDK